MAYNLIGRCKNCGKILYIGSKTKVMKPPYFCGTSCLMSFKAKQTDIFKNSDFGAI